ncbi:MAG TPA: hypothetical protein VGM59_14005 [Dongiaceae bacterium]|jgi:hypothetical protein
MLHRAMNRAAFYRRHGAMAAGLLALWLQFLAFAAPPMPGMGPWMGAALPVSDADSITISALCAADLDSGKPMPAGKSSIPCPQCPLCQTLHILAFGSVPPPAALPMPAFPPAMQSWPVADATLPPLPAPAGFSSRAPPTA